MSKMLVTCVAFAVVQNLRDRIFAYAHSPMPVLHECPCSVPDAGLSAYPYLDYAPLSGRDASNCVQSDFLQ
jgi:hypothetical protein